MTAISTLRYFLAVRLHAPYALAILLVVFWLGLYLVVANPFSGLDDALGMLLFVQMFLASTGFSERARRGHFDPLLMFSRSRTRALAAHWIVSILPGTAAWLLLCATAIVFGSSRVEEMGLAERSAALFIVSSLAWSGGLALTRGTAGFLWTAGLFATVVHGTDRVTSMSPAVVLLCPFTLIRKGPVEVWPVLAATFVALLVLLFAWRQGGRLDVYLLEQS